MGKIGLGLAILTLSFVSASLTISASGQEEQPGSSGSKEESAAQVWQVFFYDRSSGGKDKFLTPSSKDPNAGLYNKGLSSDFYTIWTDGTEIKRFPFCLVDLNGRPNKLRCHTTKSSVACKDGTYKSNYSCDKLWVEPLDGTKGTVLLNSCFEESPQPIPILPGHHIRPKKECAQLQTAEPDGADDDEYYNSSYEVLAIYHDLISIDQIDYSHARGGDRPAPSHQWRVYRLTSSALSPTRFKLPPLVWKKAEQKMRAIPKDEMGDFASDFDWSPPEPSKGDKDDDFAIIPEAGGVAAETHDDFANATSLDGLYAKVKLAHLDPGCDKLDATQFAKSHPSLLPWTKATFYSVSPDQRVVAYVLGHQLYWQPVAGPRKLISKLTDARGLQWYKGPSELFLSAPARGSHR